MVIACPSCSRKYQIDTTRIPASGTSFTCWSCRATVPISPPGLAHVAAPPPVQEPVDAPDVSPGESRIPPAAMRFFESLAAEAASRQPATIRPPKAPTLEADASAAPRAADAREMDGEPARASDSSNLSDGEAPETEESEPIASSDGAPDPSAVSVDRTADLFASDDILELPPVELSRTPAAPDVIDIPIDVPVTDDLASVAPEPDHTLTGGTLGLGGSERAETQQRTETLASLSTSAYEEQTAEWNAAEPPAPDELPKMTTHSLLAPSETPTLAEIPAWTFSSAPEVETPAPAAPQPVEPPREDATAPLRVASAPRVEPPSEPAPVRFVPTAPSPSSQPPLPSDVPAAETPAAAAQREWSGEPAPASTSRNRLLVGLAVVVVLAVAIVSSIWALTRSRTPAPVAKTPSGQTASPPAPPASAGSAEAPSAGGEARDAAKATTETPAGGEKQAVAPATTPPVSGSGAMTIQVRSSPSESEARAAVDALKAAGFDAYVQRADLGAKGVWYRVRVGRFANRGEAQSAIGKLRASGTGRDAILVPYEGS